MKQGEDSIERVGASMQKNIWVYNDRGKIKADTSKFGDSVFSVRKFAYNESGEVINQRFELITFKKVNCQHFHYKDDVLAVDTTFNESDVVTQICKYEHHSDSMVKYEYDALGKLRARVVIIYDDRRNIAEVIRYTAEGVVNSKIVREYDVYGNDVVQTVYVNNVVSYKIMTEYIYDDHHNYTKATEYWNGAPTSVTERIIEYQ